MRIIVCCLGLLLATPALANSIEDTACRFPPQPVLQMQGSEKLCRSFARALTLLPEATSQQAAAMLAPENLALMVAVTAAWLGTQGVPIVGQAVDAAVLALGVVLLATQAADVAHALWSYVNLTLGARSHAELDAAASHLSRAIATVGLNIVAFVLLKKAAAEVPRQRPPPPPRELVTPEGVAFVETEAVQQVPSASVASPMSAGKTRNTSWRPLKPVKAPDSKAFSTWLEQAEKLPVRDDSPALAYQIKHAGPNEVTLSGGGVKVRADGARPSDARLLEVKHIDNPRTSPYVPGSECNVHVRAAVRRDLVGQLRRYAAVIEDPATPAVALELITNDARAVAFFQELMMEVGIRGEVVLKP